MIRQHRSDAHRHMIAKMATLHPRLPIGIPANDAADLERAAADLLRAFEPERATVELSSEWRPARPSVATFTASNIIGPVVSEESELNTFTVRALRVAIDSASYQLDEAGCALLNRIAERWALHPQLRDLSTTARMRERVKTWCFEILASGKFFASVDFILNKLESELDNHEIWIQLADIDVQDCVPMGHVELRGIGTEQIAAWMASVRSSGATESTERATRNKLEMEWQGHTAAVYRGFGDRAAVESLAVEHAERACALIRMIEPGNLSVVQRSYLQPLTLLSQAGLRALLIDPGMREFSLSQTSAWNPPCGIKISRESFAARWEEGLLRYLHELLLADPASSFQDHLLRALLIYSRQRLSTDPIEKLIFAISGLETMLFAGARKANIKTTQKRLSALLASDETDRKAIYRVVKDAYDLRASFLHHGNRFSDLHTVEQFLRNSWSLFLHAIRRHAHWSSINVYCAELDSVYASRFGLEQ